MTMWKGKSIFDEKNIFKICLLPVKAGVKSSCKDFGFLSEEKP